MTKSNAVRQETHRDAAGFENATDLAFEDISSETYREYTFEGGEIVRIEQPLRINRGEDGHRIFDAAGLSHFIPAKWIHLSWKAREGQPHFVI